MLYCNKYINFGHVWLSGFVCLFFWRLIFSLYSFTFIFISYCFCQLLAEQKWFKFDVIYYDFGSLVLLYSSASKARAALSRLRRSNFDDKNLLAILLPYLQVSISEFCLMFPFFVLFLIICSCKRLFNLDLTLSLLH